MAAITNLKQHDDPPDVGPYGATGWNPDLGEWEVWLTARGKAFMAKWAARYGTGVGLLKYKWPDTYKNALDARLPLEDLEGACYRGAVRALCTWHPGRGVFPTYMAWFLRSAVQDEVRRIDAAFAAGVTVQPLEFAPNEWGAGLVTDAAAAAANWQSAEASAAAVDGRDRAARLRQYIRTAIPDERDREILAARFGLDGGGGGTLGEVGRRYGLSKERVRQLEARALSRLRQHSGVWALVA